MQIHSQRTASSRCRGRRSRAPTARRRRRRRTTTSTFPSGSNRSSSSRCVLSSSSFFSSAPCFNPPPAPLLAGHGQVVPRPDPLALGRHPRRPEPCRRRPRRDRDPARHALARGGRRVRQDTPGRAEARWRERGQHGQGAPARPSLPPALAAFVRSRRAKEHLHMCAGRAAVRRQRVGRARRRRGRARRARHQVRGQEPQRRALHRLGHRCVLLFLSSSLFSLCTVRSLTRTLSRSQNPRSLAKSPSSRRARPSRSRPAASTPSRARPSTCAPRRTRPTTATCPTRSSARSSSTRASSTRSAAPCPSYPRRRGRASGRSTGWERGRRACSLRSGRCRTRARARGAVRRRPARQVQRARRSKTRRARGLASGGSRCSQTGGIPSSPPTGASCPSSLPAPPCSSSSSALLAASRSH